MTVEATIRTVVSTLESSGFEYGIGGSFASSAWGQPRQTNDLDLVVQLAQKDSEAFVAAFAARFSIAVESLKDALKSRDPYRGFFMMSMDSAFQIDVFLLNELPYDLTEFSRRQRRRILPDLEAWVFSAEDTILRKLQWYVLGNQRSDKQWNDVVQVIEVREELLDWNYLAQWGRELDLNELLAKARDESLQTD